MDPLRQLNDQLRQRAHAEEQKQKLADRRLTPDQRESKEQEAKMRSIAREEAEAALKTLIIQSGQNITFSGQGRGITGSVNLPDPNVQQQGGGANGGIWRAVEDCDGATYEQFVRNVVEP